MGIFKRKNNKNAKNSVKENKKGSKKAVKTIKCNSKSLAEPKKDLKSKAKTPKSEKEKKYDRAIYLLNRMQTIDKKHLENIEKKSMHSLKN